MRLQWNFRQSAFRVVGRNGEIQFFTDQECRQHITAVPGFGTELAQHFNSEKDGRLRSDLCRLAQLREHGGVYMDTDVVLVVDILELLQRTKATFATARTTTMLDQWNPPGFFQAVLAVMPHHPVITEALRRHLEWYRAVQRGDSNEIFRVTRNRENPNVGTVLLRDAWQAWAGQEALASLERDGIFRHSSGHVSRLFFENDVDSTINEVGFDAWGRTAIALRPGFNCGFVVVDKVSRQIIIYSRVVESMGVENNVKKVCWWKLKPCHCSTQAASGEEYDPPE